MVHGLNGRMERAKRVSARTGLLFWGEVSFSLFLFIFYFIFIFALFSNPISASNQIKPRTRQSAFENAARYDHVQQRLFRADGGNQDRP